MPKAGPAMDSSKSQIHLVACFRKLKMPDNTISNDSLEPSRRLTRAESARRNGAKSRGPKSPEGIAKCRASSLKHGLYATRPIGPRGECSEQYKELRAAVYSFWVPATAQDVADVEEIVRCHWEWHRFSLSRDRQLSEAMEKLRLNGSGLTGVALAAAADLAIAVPGGSYERKALRMSFLHRRISRIEDGFIRRREESLTSGGTQK